MGKAAVQPEKSTPVVYRGLSVSLESRLGKFPRKQKLPSQQALRGLRARNDVAQILGKKLGVGEVLL